MLKKIEKSAGFLKNHEENLRCPLCHEAFTLSGYALICQNRHTFNINKKGFVNFLQQNPDTEHYTRKMFEPRRRLIEAGMYTSVLTEIEKFTLKGSLLDVGTGEGTFLNLLHYEGDKYGFDIAKDGIEMATELDINGFLSLSDLTNLPFADGSFSTILNIFTPSNYREFKRVMADKARVLKIVPDQFYLKELRELYGIPLDYDNSAVVERFKQEFEQTEQIEIHEVFNIPEKLREDFLEMSPLEWSVSEEIKKTAHQNPPHTATVHVQLLIGQK